MAQLLILFVKSIILPFTRPLGYRTVSWMDTCWRASMLSLIWLNVYRSAVEDDFNRLLWSLSWNEFIVLFGLSDHEREMLRSRMWDSSWWKGCGHKGWTIWYPAFRHRYKHIDIDKFTDIPFVISFKVAKLSSPRIEINKTPKSGSTVELQSQSHRNQMDENSKISS